MKLDRVYASRALAVTIVLLRSIVLIASTGMAAVLAHDLFYLFSETPVALVFCVPVAFLFFRWVWFLRLMLRKLAAWPPFQARELGYAPKSIG